MKIVEVGLELDKNANFYNKMLLKKNIENVFNCKTHNTYWTNVKDFNNLTENEIKRSCVRIRILDGVGGTKFNSVSSFMRKVSNYKIFDNLSKDNFSINDNQIKDLEKKFLLAGWEKIFDTKKTDYQYSNGVQLQVIEKIGLLVYYAKKDYFELDEEMQYKLLVRDLKELGFHFKNEIRLDKLRTLHYCKKCFSKNQNG